MAKAIGIVTASPADIFVEGLQAYRPIGAFSFAGRFRVIDFIISNMSNSEIDRIQVYVGGKPRSLVEHLGTGRHYNINSKKGKLQMFFPEESMNPVYNTDIAAFSENLGIVSRMNAEYVVIAPGHIVYTERYDELLKTHIESGADITVLYQRTDKARDQYLGCDVITMEKDHRVISVGRNRGNKKEQCIFLDTYVMSKKLFCELVSQARELSSMYTLSDIVNERAGGLKVQGVAHRGFFAPITDFRSYYDGSLALLDPDNAEDLFRADWPVYTRTTDSCPTKVFESASIRGSLISDGSEIEGLVENSVIGRGVRIEKGAVVRNCIVLAYSKIGADAQLENQVVDKWAKIGKGRILKAPPERPGYIRREDVL